MSVLLNERFGWASRKVGLLKVHGRGDRAAIDAVAGSLRALERPTAAAARKAAHAAHGHFAIIVEAPGYLFSCVDHCRSIPVFYSRPEAGLVVSNDAHSLRSKLRLDDINKVSALEMAMAGFVTGRHTLYEDLVQLQAGEMLWHDKESGKSDVSQYYRYQPTTLKAASEKDLITQLGVVTDRAIARVVEKADGRPIWVPLSAGLDSRLILCKLVEQGYENLFAFTYGVQGNDEVKAAREIAERLGVAWRFWPDRARDMRSLYNGATRRAYWDYSDGLCTMPNFQDFPILHKQKRAGVVPDGIVIVNGQTGDFISGGHIPKALWEASSPGPDDVFEAIVAKHYSLWQSLKSADNLSRLKSRTWENLALDVDQPITREKAAEIYERFEYQERQAKHIINGQRNYDFLELDWALPLWDREFVDFWRDVPCEHKYGQRLYKRYLEDWDYEGLFRNYQPVVWQWPGMMKAVLPVFRLVRMTLGVRARDWLLKRMLYFGMYHHLYAPFGLRQFLRHADNIRNPVSLQARHWLAEKGIAGGLA